jgi:2-haloacid dehalogenase
MKITDWSHSMPYVFDAYGTLFDFHAAVSRHHAAAGPDAALFSELWRQKQIEYTWTHTLAGRYVEFWTLTQRALDYCFERFPSVDRRCAPHCSTLISSSTPTPMPSKCCAH